MDEDQELIEELGIQDLPAEERRAIVEKLTTDIGEALAADLSEAQLQEFQSIIDQDEEVINHWLADNDPDYKKTPLYAELAEDNDGISPEKLYAYTAWIGVNQPHFEETVERLKAEVRAQYA